MRVVEAAPTLLRESPLKFALCLSPLFSGKVHNGFVFLTLILQMVYFVVLTAIMITANLHQTYTSFLHRKNEANERHIRASYVSGLVWKLFTCMGDH